MYMQVCVKHVVISCWEIYWGQIINFHWFLIFCSNFHLKLSESWQKQKHNDLSRDFRCHVMTKFTVVRMIVLRDFHCHLLNKFTSVRDIAIRNISMSLIWTNLQDVFWFFDYCQIVCVYFIKFTVLRLIVVRDFSQRHLPQGFFHFLTISDEN